MSKMLFPIKKFIFPLYCREIPISDDRLHYITYMIKNILKTHEAKDIPENVKFSSRLGKYRIKSPLRGAPVPDYLQDWI